MTDPLDVGTLLNYGVSLTALGISVLSYRVARPKLILYAYFGRYDEGKEVPIRLVIENTGHADITFREIWFVLPFSFYPYPIEVTQAQLTKGELPHRILGSDHGEWVFNPATALRASQEQLRNLPPKAITDSNKFGNKFLARGGGLFRIHASGAGKKIKTRELKVLREFVKRNPELRFNRGAGTGTPQ